MLSERLFGRKDMMVEKTLDALAMRMAAISDNIANVNTPGYVRQDVHFEDALAEAYEQTPKYKPIDPQAGPTALEMLQVRPVRTGEPQRLDGNTTSVETEVSRMVETAIAYNAMVRHTGFKSLKDIIANSK